MCIIRHVNESLTKDVWILSRQSSSMMFWKNACTSPWNIFLMWQFFWKSIVRHSLIKSYHQITLANYENSKEFGILGNKWCTISGLNRGYFTSFLNSVVLKERATPFELDILKIFVLSKYPKTFAQYCPNKHDTHILTNLFAPIQI